MSGVHSLPGIIGVCYRWMCCGHILSAITVVGVCYRLMCCGHILPSINIVGVCLGGWAVAIAYQILLYLQYVIGVINIVDICYCIKSLLSASWRGALTATSAGVNRNERCINKEIHVLTRCLRPAVWDRFGCFTMLTPGPPRQSNIFVKKTNSESFNYEEHCGINIFDIPNENLIVHSTNTTKRLLTLRCPFSAYRRLEVIVEV